MSETLAARAVLLDMDGTLVDSSAAVERIWSDWAVARGFDPAVVVRVAHGRQGQETMAELLPERSPEDNRSDNAALLAREVRETDDVVAVPGAADLLEALASYPHALVTSATEELARARMGAAGLRVPDLVVAAEAVSRSKPDPEGFLAAAAALGVAPEHCVVLEDSAAGIEAGHRAGMRVLGVGPDAAGHGASWAVTDLSEVRVQAGPDGDLVLALG